MNGSPDHPLRLGIVGCGYVTEACHLPALAHLRQQIEVIAIADMDEHRRRRVAGMFDIAQTFSDVRSMLSDASIDAVAICTPADSHCDTVIAALEAGKHVLVEKPLALTLDDADRIAAAAARYPDLKLTLGFNLRSHRLVQDAKQIIQSNCLGELRFVRTLWTRRGLMQSQRSPWRKRRESGGGILFEIAVHHIDLIRWLSGLEIQSVHAQTRHDDDDDQSANLSLQLENGVTASSTFSDAGIDANEIELFGTSGRLSFSMYQFDSLRFSPSGSGRVAGLSSTISSLPAALPILRRGGDFKESYRRQWLSFAESIRSNASPIATVEDGRESLRVVLAATASANTNQAILIANAPRQAEPVAGRSTPSAAIEPQDRPQLTAIIATLDNYQSIRRTIGYLRAQSVQNQIELLIVCVSQRDLQLDESELSGFWGHRVIEIGPFDSVAKPNAAGVRAAAAPIVVLCEDHAFPDAKWAASLIIAHRGPYAVVGPAVHNANPETAVSKADFLIGYGPWAEPIKPCEPSHLPGHNSAYKRDLLLAYGDRLEGMLEAESVLQWDLTAKGHRLYLDPSARLAHTNFSQLKMWTVVQFHVGRVFAGVRAMNWPIWKRAIYTVGSPLIPLVRFVRVYKNARRIDALRGDRMRVLSTLIFGLLLDGLGQMAGYAMGVGPSKICHEFNRVHYITERDRQQLESAAAGN